MELPDDARLVGQTDEFTAASVPAGLLREHRLPKGRYGRILVASGVLGFSYSDDQTPVTVTENSPLVIEPERAHHVVVGDGCRFRVEFYEADPDGRSA